MKIDRHFERAFQLLMPLRLRRSLRICSRRTRPRRVRSANRLDKDVASRHAALLDDVLDGKLGIATGIELSNDGGFHVDVSGGQDFTAVNC